MRFLQANNVETANWLKIIENSSEESTMTRNRALAIRMSFEKFKVKEIALICNVTIRTVYVWFDKWEEEGFDSLLVVPGQGRRTIIDPAEYDEVFEIVDQNPIQLKNALSEIQQKLGKTICMETLKRIIRKKKIWRRVRKSLKNKRNEEQFQKVKEEIQILKQDEKDGLIDLCYFDESGFSLVPEVPYAWQDKGTQICLPSSKSKRINVLGFMNKDSSLTSFVFESSVTSEVVVACFDSFIESIIKPTIVIIDNASIHHSQLGTGAK